MSFIKAVSRASKGATYALAMTCLAMSSADAQTVIINDSFADGITNLAADQLDFFTTSSPMGLDRDASLLPENFGVLDFASGDSSRTIHSLFPRQTLEELGDVLTMTFDFTTPTTIAFDGGTDGMTGSGSVSISEDFKFGLFDTTLTAPEFGNDNNNFNIDNRTMLPIDFAGPIETDSGTQDGQIGPNTALNGLAGIQCEVDDINRDNMDEMVLEDGTLGPPSGTDLGVRTHNVNFTGAAGTPTGQFLQTNTGFDFIGGGDDVIVSFAPNSDYTGSVTVEFTDDTLESLDITITMSGPSAAAFIGRNGNGATYSNTFTRTIPIVDEAADFTVFPFILGSVGVNTTSFDLIAFSATSGAWGGTVGPTLGSSAPGEDNNGIDITNITVEFTDISEMGTPIKGDVNMSGEVTFADIPPFILALQTGTFSPEADTNCDMQVSFADIPPFITLLQGN